jgi:hypothetical protein
MRANSLVTNHILHRPERRREDIERGVASVPVAALARPEPATVRYSIDNFASLRAVDDARLVVTADSDRPATVRLLRNSARPARSRRPRSLTGRARDNPCGATLEK